MADDAGGDDRQPGDELLRALPELAESAERNTRPLVRHAIEHEEPLYVSCGCTAAVGTKRHDCLVVLAADAAWMVEARTRLERGESIGP